MEEFFVYLVIAFCAPTIHRRNAFPGQLVLVADARALITKALRRIILCLFTPSPEQRRRSDRKVNTAAHRVLVFTVPPRV
jgi:hypothetical protein